MSAGIHVLILSTALSLNTGNTSKPVSATAKVSPTPYATLTPMPESFYDIKAIVEKIKKHPVESIELSEYISNKQVVQLERELIKLGFKVVVTGKKEHGRFTTIFILK